MFPSWLSQKPILLILHTSYPKGITTGQSCRRETTCRYVPINIVGHIHSSVSRSSSTFTRDDKIAPSPKMTDLLYTQASKRVLFRLRTRARPTGSDLTAKRHILQVGIFIPLSGIDAPQNHAVHPKYRVALRKRAVHHRSVLADL